ncbi:Alpha/Beta hydrolase protein [Lipomyces tetrasporus]
MASPTKVHFPSFMLKICGELYIPADGSSNRNGAAVVSKLRTNAGQPRGLEDPHQRVEDVKAAVSYLTTLKGKVDPARIGVLGICASGGYTSSAAQSDSRIRALATVSAACVGRMTRNGGLHEENSKESPEAIAGALQAAAQWRTSETNGPHAEAPVMFVTDPAQVPENADSFFKDAAAYYGSKRRHHERSDQKVPPVSFDLMIGYDSFNLQHLISPRPLLMIAGTKAQTLHYSKTAVDSAKEPKELFTIEGKNHFDLYDDLSKSGQKLVEFFGKYLQ